MSAARLLKAELYAPVDGVARAGATCVLNGGRCRCGYVFFPMQAYGCESCGASGDALTPTELSGQGALLASATVHRHQGERTAPFVVGTVQLRDGPVVRTLLAHDPGAQALTPGQPVQAVLLPVAEPAEDELVLDLRFEPTDRVALAGKS